MFSYLVRVMNLLQKGLQCFSVITTKLSRVGKVYTWQSWQANCTPCPMPRQAILLLHPELCCRGQSALQLPHIFDWICTQTIALWIVLLTGCVHTPWYHILSYYPESFSIHYGIDITDHPLSTIWCIISHISFTVLLQYIVFSYHILSYTALFCPRSYS